MPLKTSALSDPNIQSIGSTVMIRDISVWCQNVTLCLVGFDHLPDMEETSLEIVSVHGKRLLAVKESITAFVEKWFSMEVVTAPSIAEARGGILLGLQSQMNLSEKIQRREALIVLEDVFKGPRVFNDEGIFHLSQPSV